MVQVSAVETEWLDNIDENNFIPIIFYYDEGICRLCGVFDSSNIP